MGKEKTKRGKESKARKRKEEARRRRKKVLLRNRGAGLRLPKDNTLSLPFHPGFLSSCPSVLSCKEGELLWAVSPTKGGSRVLRGPLVGEACSDSRGDGPDPRLPVYLVPLGPIVQ